MKYAGKNSGFVLLLVLVVLTICSTVLVSSARRGGQIATQANEAMRQLQFRWGAQSIQAAVLGQADKLLSDGRTLGMPISCESRRTVTLGEMKFNFIISDESAKANANLLAKQHDDASLVETLRRLQADSRRVLTIQLQPRLDAANSSFAATSRPAATQPTTDPSADVPNIYNCFDQLFVFKGPAELVCPEEIATSPPCRRVTFWSSGPLNIARADILVMREVLSGLLSESDMMVLDMYRRNNAQFTTADAFAKMQLAKDKIDKLMPLVTDTSDCASVWIFAEGRSRNWYRLYVRQGGKDADSPQQWVFAW